MLAEIAVPALISRWIHLTSVIVAVGGTVFFRFVLFPSARAALSDESHQALRSVLIRRWGHFLHALITLILVTGIYNATIMLPRHTPVPDQPPLYHILFGVKVILALILFFVAIGLTGRSRAFEGLRKQAPKWMAINVALAAVIILISNILKNLPVSQ